MKPKWALKIVLFAVIFGALVCALSCAAQMLKARQLQDAEWLICPGYISSIFDSALLHGALAAFSSSAFLSVLPRLSGKLTPVEAGA